ncbi:MAG: type II secretion system protein [Pseudomonas sp.]|uniref:pilus assembly FimT family protein n=1 Tax=Pseudomonas sp. TaxID=306 RepID=UPI002735D5E7|nr:type II secretion system protein [Pseudomonas sp.]MDP3845778.1 type II secretion system protein [Pseudomonas sp.]
MKNQQSGFTLIELIMVIVIIGILAAFAVPRFADLSGDARMASLDGARGALLSANGIVHSTALARNQAVGAGNVNVEGGVSVATVEGYMAGTAAAVGAAAQFEGDFVVTDAAGVATVTLGACSFTYTEPTGPGVVGVVAAITGQNADGGCDP